MLGLPVIILWTFTVCVDAQSSPTSFFIDPPDAGQSQLYFDNRAYAIGDTLDVKWVADEEAYIVCLWQQNVQEVSATMSEDCLYTKDAKDAEKGGFPWKVTTNEFDLSLSFIFFMSLGPYASLSNATTSHYFNVTYPNAATRSSTTSTASSASTTTILTTSPISTPTGSVGDTSRSPTLVATPAPSSTTSAAPITKESPDLALPVGLAVGLGVPIIALLAFIAFRKTRQLRMDPAAIQSSYPSNQPPVMTTKTSQPTVGELFADNRAPIYSTQGGLPPCYQPRGEMRYYEMPAS